MKPLTYKSRISTFLKDVRKEVITSTDKDTFLCIAIGARITDLARSYIKDVKPNAIFDWSAFYNNLKGNIDNYIPEFNKKYVNDLGFGSPKDNIIWFTNNVERINFLDKLISIYTGNKTTLESLFKRFDIIKRYEI